MSSLETHVIVIPSFKHSITVNPSETMYYTTKIFRSNMQQDCQELLNFLLNTVAEDLTKQSNIEQSHSQNHLVKRSPSPVSLLSSSTNQSGTSSTSSSSHQTWIHEIFEGVLSSETRCLSCETIRTREESFLDLSLDIDRDCSISSCLRNFSKSETLRADSKYFCETCCSKQEAQKRMRIKQFPMVLAIHLKRFKFMDHMKQHVKLDYRVVFPKDLRLSNASESAEEEDRIYDLFAFVVHIGAHPSRGHYVTVVKAESSWVLFDDDVVEILQEEELSLFFGRTSLQSQFGQTHPLETAYILFYQSRILCKSGLMPSDSVLLAKSNHEQMSGSKDLESETRWTSPSAPSSPTPRREMYSTLSEISAAPDSHSVRTGDIIVRRQLHPNRALTI
eukprot:gene6307-7470_t